jgi:hypothetical protein
MAWEYLHQGGGGGLDPYFFYQQFFGAGLATSKSKTTKIGFLVCLSSCLWKEIQELTLKFGFLVAKKLL